MFQASVFSCSRLKYEENNYKSTTTMEEIKIKREAYVKRIKELEQEESAASSDEERKRIARKRRYVENKLYHLSLPVERRDYKVKIRFVFEGEAKVYATSKEEAKQIVKDSFGMRCGEIHASAPNILDWDIDMTPNKIVK